MVEGQNGVVVNAGEVVDDRSAFRDEVGLSRDACFGATSGECLTLEKRAGNKVCNGSVHSESLADAS